MYLLDTNVISQVAKKQPDPGVIHFLSQARDTLDSLFLSVLTLGEIYQGILKLEHRGDTVQAQQLHQWYGKVIDEFADSILPIDSNTAIRWAEMLAVTDNTNAIDKLIAATALQHNLILVTRNMAHFRSTGVQLLNPFSGLGR